MTKFLLGLLLALSTYFCCIALEARNAEGSSEEEEVISSSYVLPNQIFNNGKPYYASKDPISGQLDFNIKKPAGIDSAVNEVIDPNEKAIITSSSPNIHDFLNLPVKYSSSKFVYPLVSSSYANLKYQGSNKNYITNKKPTQVVQATSIPNYHRDNYYTVPTTKLTPVGPTSPALINDFSLNTSTTTTTTTKKPTTAATSTSSSTYKTATSTFTSTTTGTTSATSTTTTTKMPKVETSVSIQSSSSSSQIYTTTARKPSQPTTTAVPKTSTTRKKFVPNKKYTPTTSQATTTSLRFPDPDRPTASTVFSTNHPTRPSNKKVTEPVVFTEEPTDLPPFSPFPSSTRIPNLDPADVYHSLDQKNTANKFEQKPTMTLADIFNSLVEEESAVAANNPMHQGLDAQGNLMEPLDPSKPSPFAMHKNEHQPQSTFSATDMPQNAHQQQQLQHQPHQSPQSHQQPAVISGSHDNLSNEYVSYQVQQPNIMQYRPAPGAINNVVISPGQNSASFVLGSQQKVGQNVFGSVEKEPLFSKEHPVQYGTVISEDISGISRKPVPSAPTTYQEMPNKTPVSNFHQNGNFVSNQEPIISELQSPLQHGHNYAQIPPAPPSPYQQLPLVGNIRNKPSNPTHQKPLPLPPAVQNQPLPQQSTKRIGSLHSVSPQQNGDSSISSGSSLDTKELLVSTNIRFPANEEQSAEVPSLPVAAGPPASPQVNGHAQPLSLQQIQNSNPVVFPQQEDSKPQQHEGIYHNNPNLNNDVQIQKQEVLTMSQHQQKLTFPTANNPNTPAQHMVPPPLPNNIGSEHDLQKPNRPHGGPQYAYNEYTRKPIPGITRPNPDRHLPNILPQFRPNAKISSGHPQQANFNQEPGNIRVTGPQQPKRGPISTNPQFSHRRQPLGGQPKRYPLTRMADYTGELSSQKEMTNRRVYRVSPYGGAGVQYLDRPVLPVRRPLHHNLRPAESMNVERHALAPALEKLPAFEEEDLVVNDPPQPVTQTKDSSRFTDAKLEPVVTLQMLQSQKKSVSLPSENSGDGEIQVPNIANHEAQDGAKDSRNGLYVVYPIKDVQKSEAIEEAESQNTLPAVAYVEPPTGSEYQNTPFSIIRDRQQEPVLKNKKPLSLQQHTKAQQSQGTFPYPIEKPDPSYNELNSDPNVSGIVIASKITNGAYGPATEAPIAIAYTPTEPSRHQGISKHQLQQQPTMYSKYNLATPVIKEIRPDTQTEDALNAHDFDLRSQNYEKNFMAPFYPSVSLDSVTITPTNGWNFLPSSTDKALYKKNNIDRSDVVNADEDIELSTKSFEVDKFQPELQGGFKPIYPPGYKLDSEEEEQEQMQQHETNKMPFALASRMELPEKLQQSTPVLKPNSSTTSTTSTTTKPLKDGEKTDENLKIKPTETSTSTAKPTKRTKSKFETSLAALLFGDEEGAVEVDEPVEQTQARQEPTKAMMSGPRSLPRMGPRNLQI